MGFSTSNSLDARFGKGGFPRLPPVLHAVCLGVLLMATAALGQVQVSESEVLKIETRAVEVPVSVLDRQGRPVLDLKSQNFSVFEDGTKQEIAGFESVSAPFEVALLLDTSGSARGDIALIRKAAADFIKALRPGDKVSVIAYGTERKLGAAKAVTDIISHLTDDRSVLSGALDRLGSSNGTPFYDSLLKVTDKVFSEKPSNDVRGRRALVALTDGVDSVSSAEFEEAREALRASGLSLYFIQIDTREYFEDNLLGDCDSATRFSLAQIRRYYKRYSQKGNVEKVYDFCKLGDFERLAISKALYKIADDQMRELADLSGGGVIPVKGLSDAKDAFKKVADAIGTRYSFVYYPTNEKRDGAYRKIKVELKGIPEGSTVRAREGYYAPLD